MAFGSFSCFQRFMIDKKSQIPYTNLQYSVDTVGAVPKKPIKTFSKCDQKFFINCFILLPNIFVWQVPDSLFCQFILFGKSPIAFFALDRLFYPFFVWQMKTILFFLLVSTGVASSPQKRTSSTSKQYISSFL
jgi:hypothetical protein